MKYLRILVLMLLCAGGMLLVAGEIHEQVDATPDGLVEIDNLAGSVRVVGWDRSQVEVTGTLGKGTERLDVKQHGDRVHIEVVLPKGRNIRVEGSDLEVRIPRGSELEVSTVSASIRVSDVDGSLSLGSVSGGITVEGEPEEMEISNVSGRIRVDATIRRGDFNTVSGSIEATLDISSRGRCDFNSVSGSITLAVPSDLEAHFEVSTFSGGIDSDFGPRPERTSRYTPGKELNFSVGDGGARISVNSFSGRIRIERD